MKSAPTARQFSSRSVKFYGHPGIQQQQQNHLHAEDENLIQQQDDSPVRILAFICLHTVS